MFLNATFSDPKKPCLVYVKEFYEKLEFFFKDPNALKESVLDYNVIKKMYNKYNDSDASKRTYQFIASNL